ncbi:MAG: molybdopterin molybdotransferase MoeA [Alphaproteobacteria bacterium]
MAQGPDDRNAATDGLLRLETAHAQLRDWLSARAPIAGSTECPLAACRGRFLATDLVARRDVPPHDNAAVDGYAVHFADLAPDGPTTLPVAGRAAAGHPFGDTPPPRTAIRIFTGAPLPPGLDTVFAEETCHATGGTVTLPAPGAPGANCRARGEDVRKGEILLTQGRRLRPQEIGLAAGNGLSALPVYRRLRAAIFSTGDEVTAPGGDLRPGAIYDSNRPMLHALLESNGLEVSDLGIVADEQSALGNAIDRALEDHDVILSSGGMSTGEEDHVRRAVAERGRILFWRLAIRPGRPVAFGEIRDGDRMVPFIGLPGNPVAAMVTFLHLAAPVLARLGGGQPEPPLRIPVRADFAYRKKPGRREWLRVHVGPDRSGAPGARLYPESGSGILSSLVFANGLVELAEESAGVEPGEMVDFLPFPETG